MTQRPVLERGHPAFPPASNQEIGVGIEYAEREYGRKIDPRLLRVLFDTVMKRRVPGTKLPLLAATVIRDVIPATDKAARHQVDAYKGAVMKILSNRSVRVRQALDKARRTVVKASESESLYPEDPKRPGQFKLL